MDSLEEAVRQLPRGWHGRYFAEVGSTQDVAREAARAGAPSQSIYVADYQTAGRGRQGRTWLARPGQALMLSIVLRQRGALQPWRSTALASVSLVDALSELRPDLNDVAIKWPNDVLIAGHKVAGILAESTSDGTDTVVIVGIGVNVTASAQDLAAVVQPATSLLLATSHRVDRGALLLRLVHHLEVCLQGSEVDLRKRWASKLWGRNQLVQLRDLDITQHVVILGATPDGALRVRLEDGREITTTTAEIIL